MLRLLCWLKVETGRVVSGNCYMVDGSEVFEWGSWWCIWIGEARQVALGQGGCGEQKSDSDYGRVYLTWFH